jgi:hypothetical protein
MTYKYFELDGYCAKRLYMIQQFNEAAEIVCVWRVK